MSAEPTLPSRPQTDGESFIRIVLETRSLPGVEPPHVHKTLARMTSDGLIYVVLSDVVSCSACEEHWMRGFWDRERKVRAAWQLSREQLEREQKILDEETQ